MILLGMDTCGSIGTLALARLAEGSTVLEELAAHELAGKTTAAMLVPALAQLLKDAELSLSSLCGIVVVDGPGSFTGIRIGLAAAKALAEALALPIYAVSRLTVLSAANRDSAALLDASRGEVYCGRRADAEWLESLVTAEEIENSPELGRSLLANDEPSPAAQGSLVAYEEKVLAHVPRALRVAPPVALDAIRAALPLVLRDARADVASLDGRYLRRSDLYRTVALPAAPGAP